MWTQECLPAVVVVALQTCWISYDEITALSQQVTANIEKM